MTKQFWTLLFGAGLFAALAALPVSAQTPGGGGGAPPAGGAAQPGGGGGGGGGRGRGNFDPAARMEQLKKDLGATDDEFKVLQPKIEKVQDLRRADMMARFGGRGRGGPGGGGGGDAGGPGGAAPANPVADSPLVKATTELKATLDNKDSTPDQIKAKLTALRDARAKAKDELTKAQAELKDLVTVRQEAILVSQGLLE